MREDTAYIYLSFSHEAEPLSHNENGVISDNSTKDPAGGAIHTTSDYRAAKKERLYYPGQTHTPPPLRRVSSNPTDLGPVSAHRRVEGRTLPPPNYTSNSNQSPILTLTPKPSKSTLKMRESVRMSSFCRSNVRFGPRYIS